MAPGDFTGAAHPLLLVAGRLERLEQLLGELHAAGMEARLVRPETPDSPLFRAARMDASAATARVLRHEFANYLTTIRTYSHVLADEIPPETDAQADLDAMVRTLESGERFLAAVRAFVHPMPLGARATDLNEMVRRLDAPMRRLLPPGATVEVRASAAPLPVRGDEERLRWLVLELVASVGSMAGEAGHVTVATGSTAGTATASLTVACGGAGLPPERLARVFEPFVADPSYEGGLRLPTVYAAVTASGGEIDAASTAEGGVSIRVGLQVVGDRDEGPGGGP